MKTELEAVSSVKKRLKVEVPSDLVTQARAQAVSELGKKAKVEGFRPGHIPPQIIEKKFGHELQQMTIEKVVDQTLGLAFEQAKLRPISKPEINPGMWSAVGNFSYTATFEVLPEMTLKDYKGLKLEKTEVKVESKEIEEELKRLQATMTQLEPTPTETALAIGHVAIIDFKGLADGKRFQGGEAKDYVIEMGTGNMLADFEAGLKGAKAGEKKELRFEYPKDYFNKELAGKEAKFDVTVKQIRKKNVPELNDDFAKDLGNYKNLNEVRDDVNKQIDTTKENQQKGELYNQILKQLVDQNKFDLPESLVQSELAYMLNDIAQEMKRRGQKVEDLNVEEAIKELKPDAEFRVRSFLVLDQVAEDAKLEVTEQEMENRLAAIAKGLKKPPAEIKAYYEKNKMVGSLQTRILHEKALEFVLNEAKIKVVKPKKEKK